MKNPLGLLRAGCLDWPERLCVPGFSPLSFSAMNMPVIRFFITLDRCCPR